MAEVKMRYLGGQIPEPNLTIDQSYIILFASIVKGLIHAEVRGVLVDDNGEIYSTQSHIDDPAEWHLEGIG